MNTEQFIDTVFTSIRLNHIQDGFKRGLNNARDAEIVKNYFIDGTHVSIISKEYGICRGRIYAIISRFLQIARNSKYGDYRDALGE